MTYVRRFLPKLRRNPPRFLVNFIVANLRNLRVSESVGTKSLGMVVASHTLMI